MEKLINEANLIIKSDESNSDVESDDQCSSSSNESTHANKTNALREIQYHVDLLMNLLPSLYHFLEYIRQDTDHTAVVEIRFTASQAASAYINIVREKFTRAENELVERLGEANWQRHLRVRRKLEETEQEDLKEEEVLAAKSLFQPISTFHDSGLGTSVSAPSVASHSSFRTSATEGGSGSLRVPETPAEVYLGLPFKCHICGKMLTRIKNRYQWKYAHHVCKF